MKLFERNANKNMVIPKRELARELSTIQKKHGLKWRGAAKARLREKYRHKKDAVFELTATIPGDRGSSAIKMALLAQGSVQVRYNTCGKKDCPCMKDPRKKHGPYWYLSLPMPMGMVRTGVPRMKHFYITEKEAQELKARIANYRRLINNIWFELYDDFENGTVIDDMIESGGKPFSER